MIGASGATVALAAKGDLHLVSRQSDADGGAGASSRSFSPSLSDNGRFVAFTSEATNLGPNDGDATVYVYDFVNHTVETVSRQSADVGGLPANGFSVAAEISGNGRFVVFRTDATNLGGPIASSENIYVYDRRADRVQLVSRRSKSAGGGGANGGADNPSISADGRYVSYHTNATNLGGPIDGEGEANAYVYDRKQKRTFLVSRRARGGNGGNDNSFETSLAPDARLVTFQSQATNLGGPINDDASSNVYAYDWGRRRLELVSRRSGNGKGANDASDLPDVSASGRYVTFESAATNLGGPQNGPDGTRRAYLHDRRTGSTKLVSRQSKAAGGRSGNASSGDAVISNSGRFIAFATQATNLGGPILSAVNAYVYDRKRRRATLFSRATDGGPGADGSVGSVGLSGSGQFAGFSTDAMNIDPPGEPAFHGNIPPNSNVYRFQVR